MRSCTEVFVEEGPCIKKRKMLIFCLLLLISSQHIGAEAAYCIKELPCNVTKCFKISDSEYAVLVVCSSIQQTEHCTISGTRIKLKCEAQLHCFCNEEGPFELDEFPEIPVKDQSSDLSTPDVPERNNTNRTESSGSSITSGWIVPVAAVVGTVLAALGVGAIAYCVWKPSKAVESNSISAGLAQGATGTAAGRNKPTGTAAGRDRPTETGPGTGPKTKWSWKT